MTRVQRKVLRAMVARRDAFRLPNGDVVLKVTNLDLAIDSGVSHGYATATTRELCARGVIRRIEMGAGGMPSEYLVPAATVAEATGELAGVA